MNAPKPRAFNAGTGDWQSFPGKAIAMAEAIGKEEGGPWSCYFARFDRGETAPLPVPYAEIWVVVQGRLTLVSGGQDVTAGAGDFLEVPPHTPGTVRADADTQLICISVPPH